MEGFEKIEKKIENENAIIEKKKEIPIKSIKKKSKRKSKGLPRAREKERVDNIGA